MIFRRAEALSTEDNVRLDDVLWNVADVSVQEGCIAVRLSRMDGQTRDLVLYPDDLVLLA